MNTNISIPINRKRFPFILIIGILLLVLLGKNIFYSNSFQFVLDELLAWIFKTTIFFLLFFYTSISLASYVKVVFDKNANLVINDIGLVDNTSIFSCGEILWVDVLDVTLKKGFNVQYLIIKLKDPEKFISGKNFIKKYFLNNRIKKIGTPLLIPSAHLMCNLDVLKEIIVERIKK